MDKKSYKVCDQCDHDMSNKLFLEKLKSDVRQRGDMEQEAIEQIEIYNTKINNMDELLKNKKETWQNNEQQMQSQVQSIV